MHSFVRTLFRCSIAVLLLLILCVLPVRAALTAVPNAIDFGTQPINGTPQSTIVTLNNNTTRTFSIVSISDSTPEFSLSTPSLPVTLPPGGTLTVNVTFAPDAASNFTGSLGFTTSHGYTVNVPISGSGMDPQSADGPGRLSYPGSLNFTNADADAGATFMLSNSGSSPLTISSVTFAGPWLGLSGLNLSAVLAPGQSISITAFCPSASTTNGTLFIQSDAVNSMVAIPWVNGSSQGSASSDSDTNSGILANPNAASATQNSPSTSVVSPNSSSSATTRSVDLSWSPSSSGSIVGYNVYRSSVSGGPYNTVTSAPVASTAYVDNTVASAQTFYYVVTALASGGQESGFSGEVAVAIP